MTDHRREEVEDEEHSICHQVALEEERETVGNGNTRPTAKQLEKKQQSHNNQSCRCPYKQNVKCTRICCTTCTHAL